MANFFVFLRFPVTSLFEALSVESDTKISATLDSTTFFLSFDFYVLEDGKHGTQVVGKKIQRMANVDTQAVGKQIELSVTVKEHARNRKSTYKNFAIATTLERRDEK